MEIIAKILCSIPWQEAKAAGNKDVIVIPKHDFITEFDNRTALRKVAFIDPRTAQCWAVRLPSATEEYPYNFQLIPRYEDTSCRINWNEKMPKEYLAWEILTYWTNPREFINPNRLH